MKVKVKVAHTVFSPVQTEHKSVGDVKCGDVFEVKGDFSVIVSGKTRVYHLVDLNGQECGLWPAHCTELKDPLILDIQLLCGAETTVVISMPKDQAERLMTALKRGSNGLEAFTHGGSMLNQNAKDNLDELYNELLRTLENA
jgi:hypothetical protein